MNPGPPACESGVVAITLRGPPPSYLFILKKLGELNFFLSFFLQNSQAGPGRLRHQQVAAHVRGRGREGLHRRTVRAGETISHKKLIGMNIISFKKNFCRLPSSRTTFSLATSPQCPRSKKKKQKKWEKKKNKKKRNNRQNQHLHVSRF